jgi:hypothetical protein
MKRHTRTFVILATMALAAVPMLAGCVVVPAGHYWVRGHYAGHYDNRFDNRDAHPWR